MPNICTYDMRIKGKEDNILKLIQWLQSDYNYNEDNAGLKCWYVDEEGNRIPSEHHIGFRVFETYVNYISDEPCAEDQEYPTEDNKDNIWAEVGGDCAWSMASCMLEGEGYMASYNDENKKAISIQEACKQLGVEVEIFSNEPGMCFSEHYYIDEEGNVCDDDTTELVEYWLDYYADKEVDDEEKWKGVDEEQKAKILKAIENGEDYLTECENLKEDGSWKWCYITDRYDYE